VKTSVVTAMFIRQMLRWIGIPWKSKDGEVENKENKDKQIQVEVHAESIEQSVQLCEFELGQLDPMPKGRSLNTFMGENAAPRKRKNHVVIRSSLFESASGSCLDNEKRQHQF
jgi:hypothetical protein